jgi:hypothetical protein
MEGRLESAIRPSRACRPSRLTRRRCPPGGASSAAALDGVAGQRQPPAETRERPWCNGLAHQQTDLVRAATVLQRPDARTPSRDRVRHPEASPDRGSAGGRVHAQRHRRERLQGEPPLGRVGRNTRQTNTRLRQSADDTIAALLGTGRCHRPPVGQRRTPASFGGSPWRSRGPPGTALVGPAGHHSSATGCSRAAPPSTSITAMTSSSTPAPNSG